jgi:hypothetical protein
MDLNIHVDEVGVRAGGEEQFSAFDRNGVLVRQVVPPRKPQTDD